MVLVRAHFPRLIARLPGLESRGIVCLKSGLRRSITSSPASLLPKMAATENAGPAVVEAAPLTPQTTDSYKPRYIDVSFRDGSICLSVPGKWERETVLGSGIGR